MRRVGQILIGLSVLGAVVGGVNLATQLGRANGDLGAVAPLAAILFIAVTGVAAVGIYLYYRGEPDEGAPRTETELQRRIAEALGSSDRLSFQALADALDTDVQAIARLLSELARLEVIPAAISWDSAIIYPRNRGYLARQTICLHCGETLVPQGTKSITCSVCRTTHYDV